MNLRAATAETEALPRASSFVQGLSSLAFPAIATGVLGYPLDEAAPITVATVIEEVAQEVTPFRVRFVLFGPSMFDAYVSAATAHVRRTRVASERVV
jgi:O-acetyl-ADP-ribose deacetylase (regulator of RNase III)